MLGGAMRQVGIPAAAGLYALDHNVERLADDHVNAIRLAEGLSSIPALIDKQRVNTNILFLEIDDDQAARLRNHFAADGITISGQRLVTHLDIGAADIEVVIASAQHFYESEGVA